MPVLAEVPRWALVRGAALAQALANSCQTSCPLSVVAGPMVGYSSVLAAAYRWSAAVGPAHTPPWLVQAAVVLAPVLAVWEPVAAGALGPVGAVVQAMGSG